MWNTPIKAFCYTNWYKLHFTVIIFSIDLVGFDFGALAGGIIQQAVKQAQPRPQQTQAQPCNHIEIFCSYSTYSRIITSVIPLFYH